MKLRNLYIEKNLFKIFYNENNEYIGIENTSQNKNMTFYFTYFKGYGIYNGNIFPKTWKTFPVQNKESIYIILYYDMETHILSLNYEKNTPTVNKINHYQDFDYKKPINIFCGHEGGGTSIVIKLLRYLGLHFGDDCGLITNRKAHESISIASIITRINDELPTYVGRHLFNQIWSVYGYKENLINCFKRPDMLNKTIKIGEIFPNSKIVSIMRTPNGFYSKEEGRKFHEKTEVELLKYQRPLVEGTPVFNLDFYKFFTDYTYVNKLLRFLGSDNFLNNEKEFSELKELINFDDRVLKK